MCSKVEPNSTHLQEPRQQPLGGLLHPFVYLVMWAKFSNALKYRHTVNEAEPSSSDVVSPVVEKHHNLSEPHPNDDGENRPPEVPFPMPSPPGSPSKHRNGVLRRLSRSSKHDNGEPSKTSSVLKLPLRLPKKVKSQMSLQTNSKRISARPCYTLHRNDHCTVSSFSSFRQHCSRYRKHGSVN